MLMNMIMIPNQHKDVNMTSKFFPGKLGYQVSIGAGCQEGNHPTDVPMPK